MDMRSIFLSCLHSTIFTVVIALVPIIVHSATLNADTTVLRQLKYSIDPNTIPTSSYLDSWKFLSDPCESTGEQFLGIVCAIPSDNSSSRITAIYLDSVGYDGYLIQAIGNLTELSVIDLNQNNFRGPIPDSISKLTKLTTLRISGNFFTGSIPVGLTRLKKLETIDLSYNRLTGSIPTKFSGLRSLTYLSLSKNELSGKIPDLTGAWQLQTLDLGSNQLHGNLPMFPIKMRTLAVSHNLLSGNASTVKTLVNLKTLDLSYNRFTGTIGHEILGLPKVVHIDVSVNRFTALELNAFFGRDSQLQALDVQHNLIQGHLPINLVTFWNLNSINLARNQFTGRIPEEYVEKLRTSWRRLLLDHNFLTGNLPPHFTTRIRGSLANNCLNCPRTVPMCDGGQRPSSECVGRN